MRGFVHQISISRGGIPKREICEATVTLAGIEGDSFAHPRIHGGLEQAILLISLEVIESLEHQGYPVFPGALGENLTTTGIDMRNIRRGDQFHVGEVELEITKPREPCGTLYRIKPGIQKDLYDLTVGAPNWGRGGFYAKVLRPGTIVKGDIIAKAGP
jgi:MOSC domain-containing protein YiiM